jgi:hypothetical protein
MINGRNQDPSGRTKLVSHRFGEARSDAVMDLTDAYRPFARRAMRGIALLDGRDVFVQDEIDLSGRADVEWGFHTTADVELDGSVARLRQEGKVMTVRVVGPEGARFEVRHVRLQPPQKPAPPGLKKLMIRMDNARSDVLVAVLFSPGGDRAEAPPFAPLTQWGRN